MKDEQKENVDEQSKNDNQPVKQIKPSTDIADSIVTILVDKIISDAVINSKVNDIYKTINNHCFDFLTNFVNPYLKTRFIFYENGIEDLNKQKNKFYFCRKPVEKLNTWCTLPEPKNNEIDRCANTKTKLVKYKKYTDLKDDGLKETSFALDAEEDIKHMKTNDNNVFDENEDHSNYNIGIKKNKEKKNNEINTKKNVVSNNNKENNNNNKENKENKEKEIKKEKPKRVNLYNINNTPKKKEKEEILELSTVDDLPVESYENKYSIINSNEENEKLRKEKELDIERKQEMKKIEKERQEKRNRQLLMKRMEKEFDSNRLTFDPDGKVINLKYQNYDNLENGFVFSKLRIKTEKNKRKSVLNLKDIVYPIEGVEQNQQNENKNESISNTRRSTLKGKDNFYKNIDSELSKIKVEKNDEDLMWNNNNKNRNKNNNNKEKKESVLPSGGNFDKIIPEIGVVITGENAREVKEGGFDYVKKYNKPSFNELSRYISESINFNSKNLSSIMNSNNDLNKKNYNINNYANNDYIKTEENNYIGYKEEFNDNNPLIQNAHSLNNNVKYYSPNSNRYNNLSINQSNLNSNRINVLKSYDKVKSENKQYQSIQLSKNLDMNNQNLKDIFDEAINTNTNNTKNKYLKSFDVNNFENMNYLEKAVLPFKNLRYKKQNGIRQLVDIGKESNNEIKYTDESYMNKFNSQILNNKEWGKDDNDIYKMQERLNKEMNNENKSLFRKQRNNNRMKNLGIQIMTEGNKIRERKIPLFGGNLNK